MPGEFFRDRQGTPPWDIPGPQPEIVALEEAGEIHGRVLAVGCGTGENLLCLAARRYTATGIDIAETAIERARAKAVERGVRADFLVADGLALGLADVHEKFDNVIDCATFQVLEVEDRTGFLGGIKGLLNPGGRYFCSASATGHVSFASLAGSLRIRSVRPLPTAGVTTKSSKRGSPLQWTKRYPRGGLSSHASTEDRDWFP